MAYTLPSKRLPRFSWGEKLNSGTFTSLQDRAEMTLNDEQFESLAKLIDVCCPFQASMVDCEQSCSLMNAIKVKDHLTLAEVLERPNALRNTLCQLRVDLVGLGYQHCKDIRIEC